MDAEDKKDEGLGEEEQETPVCIKCFRPVSPVVHVCPHCGEAIGQFTPCLPFEGIRWEAQIWGRAWRQAWSSKTSLAGRWFRLLMIVLNAPILLLGVFWKDGPKGKQPHANLQ